MAGVERMTFGEVVRGVLEDGHADVVREALVWFCQALMEGEVAELIGAGLGERSEGRATWRSGYRPRRWGTRAGEIELQIPQAAPGQLLPVISGAAPALGAGPAGGASSKPTLASPMPIPG